MKSFFHKLMAKIVKWLDPKFAQFRTPEKKIPFTPKDEKEFIGVLKRTPKNILTDDQRNLIAGVMTFLVRSYSTKCLKPATHISQCSTKTAMFSAM